MNRRNLPLLSAIPDRIRWKGASMEFKPTSVSIAYIKEHWPDAKWNEEARNRRELAERMMPAPTLAPLGASITTYIPKSKPFAHQLECFMKSRDLEYFALLMEQGTGKTKVLLDNAAWLFSQNRIQAVVVLAKNGVHLNWITEEIPKHLPDWCNPVTLVWAASKGLKRKFASLYAEYPKPRLRILAANTEGLSTTRLLDVLLEFMKKYVCLVIIDEHTMIKNPKSKRTKNALKLRHYATYRRIASGTPITRAPLDHFAPMSFLSNDILGEDSFVAFRAEYSVMKDLTFQGQPKKDKRGQVIRVPVAWRNLDRLVAKVQPHSYRKLKKECLDLPDKLYSRRPFLMTAEQLYHYERMEVDFFTELDGRRIEAPLAMTRQMRLSQIACGYLPSEDTELDPGIPINKPEDNARLCALMEDLEELQNAEGKTIILCPWRAALRDIYSAVREAYGDTSVTTYSGKLTPVQKEQSLAAFRKNDKVNWLIAQTDSIAYGHTLTEAAYVQFYAQNFNYEIRMQVEDRPHRIGQTRNVLYTDYEARRGMLLEDELTVDGDIYENLRNKRDLADYLNGDNPDYSAEWLANKYLELDRKFMTKYGYSKGE
jgi:hypothetical protein